MACVHARREQPQMYGVNDERNSRRRDNRDDVERLRAGPARDTTEFPRTQCCYDGQ